MDLKLCLMAARTHTLNPHLLMLTQTYVYNYTHTHHPIPKAIHTSPLPAKHEVIAVWFPLATTSLA